MKGWWVDSKVGPRVESKCVEDGYWDDGRGLGWLSRLPFGACLLVGLLVCFCKRRWRLRGGNRVMLVVEDGEEVEANLRVLKLTTAYEHSKHNRSQCCAILQVMLLH